MSGFWMSLRTLLFPPRCAACGKLLDYYRHRKTDALCAACLRQWENEEQETCGICIKPITQCRCLTEEMRKAKCDAFCKLLYYRHGSADAVQNRVIFHIKRMRDLETPCFLAERLLPALLAMKQESQADMEHCVITFCPRSERARLESGTDQAKELALALSRASGIPMKALIRRTRGSTKQQKQLSARERIQNAQQSFCLSHRASVMGKTVFLVDDIVTTGAGMAACTRLLRDAGAKQVYCIAAASDDTNRDRIK